jgi:hypothetical protein
MQDARFTAQLKAAKLIARSEGDKTIRRVQFSLALYFTLEVADWLGAVATNQRDLMIHGDIDKVEIPIDAYHAKTTVSGLGGNAEMFVDGVSATATVKSGGEDKEPSYEVVFIFEAYPDAKLLTFMAAALKEHIECDFKRTQLTIEQAMNRSKDKGKEAAKEKTDAGPKSKQMTLTTKGVDKTTRSITLDKKPWWTLLGFREPPKDLETARARWRERIAETHPDRGGNARRAADLNAAMAEAERYYEGAEEKRT